MAACVKNLDQKMPVPVQLATRAITVKLRGVPKRCNVTMEDPAQPMEQSTSAYVQLACQEKRVT